MANIWKTLGTSSVGDKLIEKLRNIQDEACDCREWDDGVEKTHAQYAAGVIENKIIKKIQKNNPKKSNPNEGSGPNQWE